MELVPMAERSRLSAKAVQVCAMELVPMAERSRLSAKVKISSCLGKLILPTRKMFQRTPLLHISSRQVSTPRHKSAPSKELNLPQHLARLNAPPLKLNAPLPQLNTSLQKLNVLLQKFNASPQKLNAPPLFPTWSDIARRTNPLFKATNLPLLSVSLLFKAARVLLKTVTLLTRNEKHLPNFSIHPTPSTRHLIKILKL